MMYPSGPCPSCDGDEYDEAAGECPECGYDGDQFADPGGNSALRAASHTNPRNLPCPDCGAPDRLTPADRARGYCCDACADRNEGKLGGSIANY